MHNTMHFLKLAGEAIGFTCFLIITAFLVAITG